MRLSEIPARLPANRRNWVQFTDPRGQLHRWTFPEIDARGRAVAEHLRGRLARLPDDERVAAISGPPGIDWLLAALACVYLGVEIVAVPESLPQAEQLRLARAHRARVFIDVATNGATGDVDPALDRVSFDELATGEPTASASYEHARFQAVAFTSGSSSAGVKAFRIVGDATESFIENFVRLFRLSPDDSWLICHPFSHIVHLEYALGGLCLGYNLTLAAPLRVMLGNVADTPAALVSVPSVYQGMADQIRKKMPTSGVRALLLRRWLDAPVTGLTRLAAPWISRVLAPGAVPADWAKLKVAIIGAAPSGPDLQRFLTLMGLPMFEGYGMSETQMLTCNVPGRARFGTVGPAWPGVSVRLSERNELQVKLDAPRTSGYLDDPEATEETFGEDDWINTGDVAAVRDGYWSIVGRIKSTIVLSHGKNVSPESIERKLDDIARVRASLVVGDARPHLVALLVVGTGLTDDELTEVREGVLAVNSGLPAHERIADYLVLDEDKDVPADFFTRSGKIRRAAVSTMFADELDALYARQKV